MKLRLLLFILSLLSASSAVFGLISVGNVTVERADELGIELRVRPGGPKHAWVELEFKAEGALSEFQHVSLEIPDGDLLGLGWTPLKDKRTYSGSVIVRLMGSRNFLKRTTLRIVLGDFDDSGLDVRLKDFVDFDTLQETKPSRTSGRGGSNPIAPSQETKPNGDLKSQAESEGRSR